jgi:hypothetical protein
MVVVAFLTAQQEWRNLSPKRIAGEVKETFGGSFQEQGDHQPPKNR